MNLATAKPTHRYAQLDPSSGVIVSLFVGADKPTWDNDVEPAIDITSYRPRPRVGFKWTGSAFVAPAGPFGPVLASAARDRERTITKLKGLISTLSPEEQATHNLIVQLFEELK